MESLHPRVHDRRLRAAADRVDPAERRAGQRLSDLGRRAPDQRQPGHGLEAPGRGHGPPRAGRRRALRHPQRPRQHQAELDQLIAEWSATLTSAELEELLNEHSVPNGKIYTAPDMLEDAHFAAREAIVKLAHPQLGEFPMQNVVPKLSDTPGAVRWVGPELGEHTDEVLAEVLGIDGDEATELRSRRGDLSRGDRPAQPPRRRPRRRSPCPVRRDRTRRPTPSSRTTSPGCRFPGSPSTRGACTSNTPAWPTTPRSRSCWSRSVGRSTSPSATWSPRTPAPC